jgi:hypothetical protein
MDAQESVGGRETFRLCLKVVERSVLKEESGSKTMTNDIAMRDDMKSVERWENEGGKVLPLNNLWASLKRFTIEDNARERQILDAQKNPQRQPEVFSTFDVRRAF